MKLNLKVCLVAFLMAQAFFNLTVSPVNDELDVNNLIACDNQNTLN